MVHRIRIISQDVTTVDVDAIVNAANEWMLGGGGVDGAIHEAAGPKLLEACRAVPLVREGVRCPTGESRITPGFCLPARHVIHAVGPVWRGGMVGEAALLKSCYTSALLLASQHGVRSLAIPAISCGAFGFPTFEAAKIAKSALLAFLRNDQTMEKIVLVAIDSDVRAALEAVFPR